MKRKLIWLTAIGAVVAVAYAQSLTVRGALGFGLAGAPDAERPNAQFNFSVKQAEYNGQTRLGGGFAIEVREANRLVSIQMANAQRLAVDIENKRAIFSGPAVAVVRTRQGVERARGVVVVRVDDNRTPRDRQGDPDTIRVAFYTDENSDPAFTYEGVVRLGDILVYERTYSR
jgi:hypothetical protein